MHNCHDTKCVKIKNHRGQHGAVINGVWKAWI